MRIVPASHVKRVVTAAIILPFLGLAGCFSNPGGFGTGQYPPEELTSTGSISLKVPEGYEFIENLEDRYGWPWAAVKKDDQGEIVALLVMNGNYSNSKGPEFAVTNMQGLTKLAAEEYSQSEIMPYQMADGSRAAVQDYEFTNDEGVTNTGTYAVMCKLEMEKCGMVRYSDRGNNGTADRDQILESIKYNPEKTEEQPSLAELQGKSQ